MKEWGEGGGEGGGGGTKKKQQQKKRLRNKYPPTLLTSPLVLLLGITTCERPLTLFTGESPALRHRTPPPPSLLPPSPLFPFHSPSGINTFIL